LESADHSFAQDQCDARIPLSLNRFNALPMARSPFGRFNTMLGLANVARLDALSRRIAATIDRGDFDVVLVHPCQVTQTPLLLRWLRTPSMYYCHELPRTFYEQPITRPYTVQGRFHRALDAVDPLRAINRATMRSVDRQSARRATRIVANSHVTRRNIAAAYGRSAEVCSPSVDMGRFQPIAAAREQFVLSVGALTPAKGFDFVILALGTLPDHSRPRLVLVNNYQEAAEREYLTTLACLQGVSVEYHVGVTEAELRMWYARAGCVAYAPVREPYGLVALEAMAAEAPIVGVADGGLVETVTDNVTGLLTCREPAVFGRAIHQILTQPALAQQLGAAARSAMLVHRTWDTHMEHLQTLLLQTARTARNARA
jgi:glycosyltransferase involved in cell wall biosynthesis